MFKTCVRVDLYIIMGLGRKIDILSGLWKRIGRVDFQRQRFITIITILLLSLLYTIFTRAPSIFISIEARVLCSQQSSIVVVTFYGGRALLRSVQSPRSVDIIYKDFCLGDFGLHIKKNRLKSFSGKVHRF